MKVGDWVYHCCEYDLEQITDEVMLAEIQEDQAEWDAEFSWSFYKVFATREEAMAHIGPDGWISHE